MDDILCDLLYDSFGCNPNVVACQVTNCLTRADGQDPAQKWVSYLYQSTLHIRKYLYMFRVGGTKEPGS